MPGRTDEAPRASAMSQGGEAAEALSQRKTSVSSGGEDSIRRLCMRDATAMCRPGTVRGLALARLLHPEMPSAMDLRSLKYVSTAIRLQSISKAAAELYIAQPALSRQIRLLEEELGVTLLLRHRRGVTPTSEGIKVMEAADVLQRLARHPARRRVGVELLEEGGDRRVDGHGRRLPRVGTGGKAWLR